MPARSAASAAPGTIPTTAGSAIGLRRTRWRITPLPAIIAPTAMPITTRGSRMSRRIRGARSASGTSPMTTPVAIARTTTTPAADVTTTRRAARAARPSLATLVVHASAGHP